MNIPDHLLERTKVARVKAEGIDGTVVMQTSVFVDGANESPISSSVIKPAEQPVSYTPSIRVVNTRLFNRENLIALASMIYLHPFLYWYKTPTKMVFSSRATSSDIPWIPLPTPKFDYVWDSLLSFQNALDSRRIWVLEMNTSTISLEAVTQ